MCGENDGIRQKLSMKMIEFSSPKDPYPSLE